MAEVVGALFSGEGVEELADAGPERLDGSLGCASEEGLQLGEDQFDRIEVGAVGRQVEEAGSGLFDEAAYAQDLVGGEIVHDDDVAGAQGRDQDLLDVDEEGFAVHGAVEDEGRDQAVAAQTGGEGGGLPVSPGLSADQPSAPWRAAPGADHLGVGAGLVDEDQLVRIEARLIGPPAGPRRRDVRSFLFGRLQGFF